MRPTTEQHIKHDQKQNRLPEHHTAGGNTTRGPEVSQLRAAPRLCWTEETLTIVLVTKHAEGKTAGLRSGDAGWCSGGFNQ